MPMIVDPSAPLVTMPSPAVSADGWLTAVLDPAYAGVVLSYNADTAPSVRNLTLNPSVEVDLSNTLVYGSATRARVTTDAEYGTACIQHTQSTPNTFSGTQYMIDPQSAGIVLWASVWVKVPGSGTTVYFTFRSSAGALGTVNVGTPTANTWVRVFASFTVPAGQVCERVSIAYNAPTGAIWWSDAMQVEAGVSAPSVYTDGSLTGCAWEGTANASTSIRITSAPNVADIRKIRITRQDPGGAAPVAVRSADSAWAVGGVGVAYDHEAPLGVAVTYQAIPEYVDGSSGTASEVAVTLANPTPPLDVWIKSLDTPGLSALVTVTDWPELQWAARIDQAQVAGSRYATAGQDVYSAATSTITIDAVGDVIETVRALLSTAGVRLIQTRSDYHRPDQYVLFGDVTEAVQATPTGGRTFTATVTEVERPDTVGQPLRMPGWSYDTVASTYATYDAVEAAYSSYASLATNGAA